MPTLLIKEGIGLTRPALSRSGQVSRCVPPGPDILQKLRAELPAPIHVEHNAVQMQCDREGIGFTLLPGRRMGS